MTNADASFAQASETVGRDRVLLCVEQLRRRVPGGIGTYATGLISGLLNIPSTERPVVALFGSRAKERPDPLRCYGLSVITSSLPEPFASRLWGFGVGRVRTGASIVHSTSFGGPPTSAPLIVTIHDLAWRALPAMFSSHGIRWHESALRRATSHAEHFVVPSREVAEALSEADPTIGEERITVIEHGADHLPAPDEEGTTHLLASLGIHGEFLLAVGTLEPRKNLARLIDAYRRMQSRLPEPWPLVVVGPKGWGETVVATEGVVLAGDVSNAVLSGLYARARLFAYVPMLEGFGLPIVEAMHAGTPVVSSAVPSAGGATQLVDPTSVDEIAEALYVAACDDARRQELHELGMNRVAKLTWRESASKHVRLWRNLAAPSR